MPAGKKWSYGFKQNCNFYPQVCLSMYDLLLLPDIKGLTREVYYTYPFF